jgi:hypothetical protein
MGRTLLPFHAIAFSPDGLTQRADNRSTSVPRIEGESLAAFSLLGRFRDFSELFFFLGEQLEQRLSPCLIPLVKQLLAIVLNVETSDRLVHGSLRHRICNLG